MTTARQRFAQQEAAIRCASAACRVERMAVSKPEMLADGYVMERVDFRRWCSTHGVETADNEDRCPFGVLHSAVTGYIAGMNKRLSVIEGIISGLEVK